MKHWHSESNAWFVDDPRLTKCTVQKYVSRSLAESIREVAVLDVPSGSKSEPAVVL